MSKFSETSASNFTDRELTRIENAYDQAAECRKVLAERQALRSQPVRSVADWRAQFGRQSLTTGQRMARR